MKVTVKSAIAAGLLLVGLASAPAAAPAAEQCLFQNEKAGGDNRTDIERSLLCLTNLHRVRNGRALLLLDTRLAGAARAYSTDMASRGFFDHTSPEGTTPTTRASAAGYPGAAGENLATDLSGTVLSLFDQWRNSTAGHNENMLGASYRAAGFGIDPHCCPAGFAGITGTQMFGNAAANTDDDGLGLYASSERCAKAKVSLIEKRKALKKGKRKGGGKGRLKEKAKAAQQKVDRLCDELS